MERTLITVKDVQSIGEGKRVCVDVVDALEPVEGMFAGSTGAGGFLVLSEHRATATYPPRTFRVNVGALHQYVWVGEQTSYAAELRGGDTVMVGSAVSQALREVAVGRIKMETRPLLRVTGVTSEGVLVWAVIQNADSVHLATPEGKPLPIEQLTAGCEVQGSADEPGRHLGERTRGVTKEFG
ncbi:3-dehydroquinate synthase II [Salsuginibacillus halophilus]|uniref:3-dehydroquinate synthase II n=1 Tax=Salsuginibacillus halophilus TaxID=517424 RepID=A0A2P8HLC4_9BACI|nr:3-dehydroquinate synthase II [Salsuginibacillus halophilus]PSL47019.1 3-dehydroquinate synthase II [Salsuginibacillus halophilus]